MKQSPQDKKLEELLHSSTLVAGGFMGDDTRSVSDVIGADRAVLQEKGVNAAMLAQRMRQLTALAETGLGTWVDAPGGLRVMVEDYKGNLTCPWPHAGQYYKRVTTLEDPETGQTLMWTDLNVHLIEEHQFFEGKGSGFRIDPEIAIKILFEK